MRNNGVVVGETALDLAADDDRAAEFKAGVLLTEGHLDLVLLFRQQVLEQRSGFLRQNETGCGACLHAVVRVADQTVCISSYHRHFVLGDVKENTVHHRTQIIVGSAENGLLDRALEHVSRDGYLTSVCLGSRHLRILVAVHADERVGTVLADHADCEVLLVDGEGQRLLAELLERLQQQFGGRCHLAGTFHAVHLDAGTDGRLAVRSGQLQFVARQVKQHVVQDGKCILTVNHTAYCL